jgi:hypothetical protein
MTLAICPKCGRTWNGSSACHCAGCCEHFGSLSAFDRHRVDFECLPVALFSAPFGKHGVARLVRSQRASGDVWVTSLREMPDDGEEPPSE